MPTRNSPNPGRSVAPAIPSFVVRLTFRGIQQGVVGPFDDEAGADAWVVALLGGEDDWAAEVIPITAPDAPLLAARRRAATRRQRHLHVVR